MKKYIILTLILTFLASSVAFAAIPENLPKDHKIIGSSLFIDGNRVMNVVIVDSGNVQEISVQEYISKLKKKEISFNEEDSFEVSTFDEEIISPLGMTDDWYRYDETSKSVALRSTKRARVSTALYNNTSIPAQLSYSTSASDSQSFSTNVTSSKISYIQAGATFTWYTSKTTSQNMTLTVSPFMFGWWEFSPYENKTVGKLKTFDWLGVEKSAIEVFGYSPKVINGLLDGIYYAVENSTAPN